ncbi:hypothetical protein CDAR_241131 [Caerostris darwini]|uniref:Uncharacterized protein n=1 Tax=Caerostris darwini TaxID=1538125 RepID=A0AAV4TEA3_9ARAC|nr:hypothetical protein CDAR_241131 [Caerostris darwini]
MTVVFLGKRGRPTPKDWLCSFRRGGNTHKHPFRLHYVLHYKASRSAICMSVLPSNEACPDGWSEQWTPVFQKHPHPRPLSHFLWIENLHTLLFGLFCIFILPTQRLL